MLDAALLPGPHEPPEQLPGPSCLPPPGPRRKPEQAILSPSSRPLLCPGWPPRPCELSPARPPLASPTWSPQVSGQANLLLLPVSGPKLPVGTAAPAGPGSGAVPTRRLLDKRLCWDSQTPREARPWECLVLLEVPVKLRGKMRVWKGATGTTGGCRLAWTRAGHRQAVPCDGHLGERSPHPVPWEGDQAGVLTGMARQLGWGIGWQKADVAGAPGMAPHTAPSQCPPMGVCWVTWRDGDLPAYRRSLWFGGPPQLTGDLSTPTLWFHPGTTSKTWTSVAHWGV